jgi:NAD(P)H-hydrate epimerase
MENATGIEITSELVRTLLPRRPDAAHKGTFGHVFIIAGSRGFTGAAILACEGASRSGVGLVTVGVPRPLGDVMAASLVETMSFLLPSTDAETLAQAAVAPALEFAASKQAVVLGPGISQHPETRAFVLEFVRRCPAPILIDADGLNALSTDPGALLDAAGPRVLTPHPGEMARLTGKTTAEVQADRVSVARDFVARYRCVAVLKGYRTVVADTSGEVYVNPTGNAGLAKGGTGDVLSGVIGGLMAQGASGLHAALAGVYAHGLAGDLAAKAQTQRGMTALDVVDALPAAWRAIEW